MVKQSTKAVNHADAKHYRIAQAYVRQAVSHGIIKVCGIDTEENEADMFTKALGPKPFAKHRAAVMGPQVRPQ